jgi:hypothetical protein
MNKTLTKKMAWRNVLLATVTAWVIFAIPNSGFLANYLAKTMGNDLVRASLYVDLGYALSAFILITLIVCWQNSHGETLANLGVNCPTPKKVMVVSVIFGTFLTAFYYFVPGHLNFLAFLTGTPNSRHLL